MPVEVLVSWHMALLPLVYLVVRKRDASVSEWLVAIGFSVSWFADFVGSIAPHLWEVVELYPALQLPFFAVAAGAGLWVPVLMALLAFTELPWLIVAVGSLIALAWSAGTRWGPVVLLYCGVGSLFFLGLLVSRENVEAFMALWWPYQLTRLAAIVWFIALLHPRRKEAPA